MPLGDIDHMLHFAMRECEEGFVSATGDLYKSFDRQLNALAKFFSKRDCVELYIQRHIQENPSVPQAAKKTLSAMFDVLCPTLVKHRWHYAFDVMHWLSRRQQLILE